MDPLVLPLNSICSCWHLQLIPSAIRDLQRGIQREKDRFVGRPFVLVMTCRDYCYDGVTGRLELLEGFADQTSAIQYAQTQAASTLSQTLTEPPRYGDRRWRFVGETSVPRSYRRHATSMVASVFTKRFEVACSEYDSKAFEFDVIHVTAAEVVGTELLCFLDAEWEWASYLIDRGRTQAEP